MSWLCGGLILYLHYFNHLDLLEEKIERLIDLLEMGHEFDNDEHDEDYTDEELNDESDSEICDDCYDDPCACLPEDYDYENEDESDDDDDFEYDEDEHGCIILNNLQIDTALRLRGGGSLVNKDIATGHRRNKEMLQEMGLYKLSVC